jgi:hypothetical protein
MERHSTLYSLLQPKIAFEVNSAPLSDTIIRGLPRRSMRVVSSRATRLPEVEVSGMAAGHSRVTSLAEVAEREGKVERHVRFLAPLAFGIVAAIMDGSAPGDLTVTALAASLPHTWSEQERRLGLACARADKPEGGGLRDRVRPNPG